MKEGVTVIIRNAKIDMFKGSMRLAVDKWGRVEVAEPADFVVKEENNLSLVEYELVNVVDEWVTVQVRRMWCLLDDSSYVKCDCEFNKAGSKLRSSVQTKQEWQTIYPFTLSSSVLKNMPKSKNFEFVIVNLATVSALWNTCNQHWLIMLQWYSYILLWRLPGRVDGTELRKVGAIMVPFAWKIPRFMCLACCSSAVCQFLPWHPSR